MITALPQQNYSPAIAIPHTLISRIDTAYRAAGLNPPSRAIELERLLADEPGANQVAADLAAQALTVADPAAFVEDAIEQIKRAHAVDALRTGLRQHHERTVKAYTHDLTSTATAELRPAFDKAVTALAKAAKDLPAGHDALDITAVVDADATKAMKAAQAALRTLADLAGIHELPNGMPDLHGRVLKLLPVLTFPTVPVEQVSRLSGAPVDQDDTRDTVRRLVKDATDHGEDRVLIGVARGEYGDAVRFHFAADRADLFGNAQRALTALRRKAVDVGPKVTVF